LKKNDLTPRARVTAFVGITAVGVLALAGCAGGGGSTDYVEDGTFVYALGTDIGSLDPALGVTSAALAVGQYAYDPLVHLTEDGTVVAGLATEWGVDGTTVSFTLRDDVTCADGAAFTATTAKRNIDFIADPNNASPLLGAFVPVGVTTEADDEAGTLTLTLAAPSPFVIEALSNVVMVCDKGLDDRSSIVTATDGTGPFILDEAVANDHYTYTVREGYSWGPDGATTGETGTPAKVEFRVIPNETTAANLLVSGDINAAQIVGPDAARLTDLQATSSQLVLGEGWFNQAADRVTADLAVRTALVQALDLDALANVISSGTGKRATQLAVVDPAPCQGGDFTSAFPAPGVDEAAGTLEGAGWAKGADGIYAKDGKPLTIAFIHDTALGTGGDAAAELAVTAWQDLGVVVNASGQPTDQISGIMFGGGDWDLIWEPLNVSTPDQLVGYLSGPTLAEGGTNFASIQNADYVDATTAAMGMVGTEGCSTWFEAETALVQNVDVLAFANSVLYTYAKNAEFSGATSPDPTSIRLTK
jgi:peptide/nickel transport system substrate-binding protein